MLRSDRLTGAADRLSSAASLLTSAVRGRKSALYVGTALALASAGSASAATVGGSTPTPLVPATTNAAAAQARFAALTHPVAPKPATPKQATPKQATPKQATPKQATPKPAAHQAQQAAAVLTWKQVRDELNRRTNPVAAAHGKLPLADRLMPVGTSGPQAWMPLQSAQVSNATTIVRQALKQRMGIRSAVIAVATAMQESQLLNIGYGTEDSLGLFQQQPDCGWGNAQQVMNPTYASDAFLGALRRYQAGDPSWAEQPLWQAAQGVQNSAFPYAYAKWETQAAQLVKQAAMHML